MKLKNYLTIGISLLITISTFAQSKMQKKADELFNNFAFVQAATAYTNLINKGTNTDYAIRQLADTYAYMRNADSAAFYYEKAIKQNNIPIQYYYNYAQALRGVENYEASRTWMKKFKDAGGSIKERYYLDDAEFLNSIFNAKKYYTLKEIKFNSKFSDFGAYEHDSKIYFTSARDEGDIKKHLNSWDEEPFLNIYAIDKEGSNTNLVGNKTKLKGKVNSVYHDGPLTITKDGKTMYFSRTDFRKNILGKNGEGISNLKIYKATFIEGKWQNIEELPFNSNHYSNGHPALNEDETKLYFASDRSGGYGGSDIYYVNIDGNNFGKPQNLGNIINTNKNEKFPFINSEGAIFFSSDGHPGLGLLDIFGTVLDENKNIINIINLGTPVNSSKDDFSFFMNNDGLSGYFASNRKGGIGSDDIYGYDRTPQLQIQGKVYDNIDNTPIANAIITLVESNKEVAQVTTNKKGYYIIDATRGYNYQIKVNKEGYTEKTKSISSVDIDKTTKSINNNFVIQSNIKKELNLNETQKMIVLSPIYFDYKSAIIRNEDKQVLDTIINSMLNLYPEMIIKIESFSDARGPEKYNVTLSEERALTSYQYLINKGVSPKRIISYKGYGEDKLTNDCNSISKCTETQHQANRRTEFIVVKMK